MGLFQRRQSRLAGRDFLDLVPARAADSAPDDGTNPVVVLLPRFRDPLLGRLLQPRLPESRCWVKVRLDARGSALWRAVDGATPIRGLVPVYTAAFPDDVQEAPERVCRWFYAGYESGLLEFANL